MLEREEGVGLDDLTCQDAIGACHLSASLSEANDCECAHIPVGASNGGDNKSGMGADIVVSGIE